MTTQPTNLPHTTNYRTAKNLQISPNSFKPKCTSLEAKVTKVWLGCVAVITLPFTLVSSVVNGILNKVPVLMIGISIGSGIFNLWETTAKEISDQNDNSTSFLDSTLKILKCSVVWKSHGCNEICDGDDGY